MRRLLEPLQLSIGSIESAYTTSGFTRAGKRGRDLHHEGLAEPAKVFAVGLDVPGALDDIVIILVDDDPALLEIAKTLTRKGFNDIRTLPSVAS